MRKKIECPKCGKKFYRDLTSKEGALYCPRCGKKIEYFVTGGDVHLDKNPETKLSDF